MALANKTVPAAGHQYPWHTIHCQGLNKAQSNDALLNTIHRRVYKVPWALTVGHQLYNYWFYQCSDLQAVETADLRGNVVTNQIIKCLL